MKKRVLSLLVILFAALTLFACQNKIDDLNIYGYQTDYTIGDTFTTEGLKVEANYNDSATDVTSECQIDSSGVNMEVAGTYAVIVKYNGVERTFYVKVNEKTNTEKLINLEVDTTNAKLSYLVGETYSSDNLGIIATYSNTLTEDNTIKYLTDLSDFQINVYDENKNVITEAFNDEGSYDVVISQGDISSNYSVTVTLGANDIETAVNVAVSQKDLVAGGESINNDSNTNNYFGKTTASYEYGQDLNSITYKYNNHNYVENYFLDSNNEIIGVRVDEDFEQLDEEDPNYDPFAKPLTILDNLENDYITGMDYTMFAGTTHFVGAEGLLKGLYDLGKTNPNYDYSEQIIKQSNDLGEITNVYNFSFSYLVEAQTTTVFYLHVVDVSFTLGEGNFLETLDVKNDVYVVSDMRVQFIITPKGEPNSQIFYEPGRILPDGRPAGDPSSDYPEQFPVILDSYTINDCMGRLLSGQLPSDSYSNSFSIRQYKGEKDAVNKYPESEIYVTNYDILDENGNVLDDLSFNTMIDDPDNSDQAIDLVLGNFNSETARIIDTISVIYNGENIGNFYYEPTDLILHYNNNTNTLKIRCFKYGTYNFELVTLKTSKQIVVDVSYREPTTFTTQVFRDSDNPNDAVFEKRSSIECFVNDVIYFNVEANTSGDSSFLASCDDLNALIVNNPTDNLPEALYSYDGYFSSFTASVPGEYLINLKSTRNNVSSTLTIIVKEVPDFTQQLTGTYEFEAYTSGVKEKGTITFTLLESTDYLLGKAEIKIGDFSETVTFSFSGRDFVDTGHYDGDKGRIKLSVNDNLEFVISGSYQKDGVVVYQFSSILVR